MTLRDLRSSRRPARLHLACGAAALLVTFLALRLSAGTVGGSKHDISTPGGGYSDQVCAFCHTPHFANRVVNAPLWNRFVDQSKTFVRYSSTTMNTVPGDPNLTISVLCLGCHDGTLGTAVVGGITGSDKHDLVNAPGPGGMPDTSSWPDCRRCHGPIYGDPPPPWLGTNLSKDHPIAMTYPTAVQDPKFKTPPDLSRGWSDVRLWEGKVECPTCHNAHDPAFAPFLRKGNDASRLCLTCHEK